MKGRWITLSCCVLAGMYTLFVVVYFVGKLITYTPIGGEDLPPGLVGVLTGSLFYHFLKKFREESFRRKGL